MKKLIAAILSIAAIALPQSSIAQVAAKDSADNIIVTDTGLVAGTLVKIYYPQVFDSRNFITSGVCNLLTIKKTQAFAYYDSIKVNGVQLNLSRSNPPELAGVPCLNGVPNPALAWITTGVYKYLQTIDKVYVVAPSAGSILVSGDMGNFRLGKVDKCGRISIKNSEKWPMAGLNLGGALSYMVNGSYGPDIAIPTATTTAMPICYRGTLYKPLNP